MSIQIQYIIITASLSHPTYWYKHTMQEFSSQAFVEAHLGMPRCLKGVARPKSINFRRFFSILSSRMDFKGSRWVSTKREKRINNAAALHHPSSFIIHHSSFILDPSSFIIMIIIMLLQKCKGQKKYTIWTTSSKERPNKKKKKTFWEKKISPKAKPPQKKT